MVYFLKMIINDLIYTSTSQSLEGKFYLMTVKHNSNQITLAVPDERLWSDEIQNASEILALSNRGLKFIVIWF
jgi:hypothetical protein